jgi:hypothetical protein
MSKAIKSPVPKRKMTRWPSVTGEGVAESFLPWRMKETSEIYFCQRILPSLLERQYQKSFGW